jgi:resolvase-like protein
VDTSLPMGELMFQIIGAISQFERSLIAERVRSGLANARAKGKVLGRPPLRRLSREETAALRRDRSKESSRSERWPRSSGFRCGPLTGSAGPDARELTSTRVQFQLTTRLCSRCDNVRFARPPGGAVAMAPDVPPANHTSSECLVANSRAGREALTTAP